MVGELLGQPDERAPLVLLPGLTFDRRIWRPVLEHLDQVDPGRQVLTLDLPGHGDSPYQLPHSVDHVVELLRCAIATEGLRDPVLVGHSMAGGIASVYAAHHPVGGVINVDGVPVIAPFVRLIQSMIDLDTGAGVAAAWAIMEQSFRTDLLPVAMRLLVAENSRPDPDLILSYWHDLLLGTPEHAQSVIDTEIAAVANVPCPTYSSAECSRRRRCWNGSADSLQASRRWRCGMAAATSHTSPTPRGWRSASPPRPSVRR